VVNPRDVVVISRARLQEVVDEAVARGRITRSDATELVAELLAVPRDLARRVAGRMPIAGYDDLTAAEIVRELENLRDADLRRVAEYERANANRKTVLAAVERKLG
jgi:polyhydroxyalkanoate synthesis regulator phasin